MEKNTNANIVAKAVRQAVIKNLDQCCIKNEEVDALIDEISKLVVSTNKVFVAELISVQNQIKLVHYRMDEMNEDNEALQEQNLYLQEQINDLTRAKVINITVNTDDLR